MNKENMPKVLGGIGVVAGIVYAMRKKEKFTTMAIYAVVVGAIGFGIGTAIQKQSASA